MRSVDVVFPASMCAMIPMLRVSSSLNALPIAPGTAFFSPARVATASLTPTTYSLLAPFLPAIMRERLVGFRHAMHVFLLLHRSAARVRRVNQLVRELVHHGLTRALPRILQQPANCERLPAERIHFHRNLVVRAANATRLHFQQRLHVLDGFLENLQRVVVGLLRYLIHRAVKHPLRRRLLAFPHHRADELLHNVAGIDRIGRLHSPENKSFAWHCSLSLLYFDCAALGRFAPYFERPCLRFSTPAASARRAHKIARAQSSAERSTANPEIQPARNSVRTPRSRTTLLASVRRGLLGFAGLAPHSGRSSVPFRLTLFRD